MARIRVAGRSKASRGMESAGGDAGKELQVTRPAASR